jgi:large subunit ribosomal protein L5e
LDVGLVRTTTGNRVFGALKGATDGGLYIPHSVKRFPGFTKAKDEGETETYNAKSHRDRIFGNHIDNYMKSLKEKGGEAYKKQFSKWDVTLKESKLASIEKLIEKVHGDIRKNPDRLKKATKKDNKRDHKKFAPKRLNAAQRKANVEKKFKIATAAASKKK